MVPLFIIEREFADQLDLTDESVRAIEQINAVIEVSPAYGDVPYAS